MAHGLIFRCVVIVLLVSHSLWAKVDVSLYLLPDDHPMKSSLDALFSSSRCTLNLNTLEEAGFAKTTPRKFTKLIVTKHPLIPGYIFKLYLDAQRPHQSFEVEELWIQRIRGAEKIRKSIHRHGWQEDFKVPRKWIYALPSKPYPPKGYAAKRYILVEEDMQILPKKVNDKRWASDQIAFDLLVKLYVLLKEVGLDDCAKPDNIPFSKDGKIAFIDTQTFGNKVPFRRLSQFLSQKNKTHWKKIITQRF